MLTEGGSITTSIRSKLRDRPWTLESRRSTSTPKRLKAQLPLSPMDLLESSRETGLMREQDGSWNPWPRTMAILLSEGDTWWHWHQSSESISSSHTSAPQEAQCCHSSPARTSQE